MFQSNASTRNPGRLRAGRYVRPTTRKPPATGNPEHWSVSYLDLLTLLLTLFVLLFAIQAQTGKQQETEPVAATAPPAAPAKPFKVAYSALPRSNTENPLARAVWQPLDKAADVAAPSRRTPQAMLIPAAANVRLPATVLDSPAPAIPATVIDTTSARYDLDLPKAAIPLVVAKTTAGPTHRPDQAEPAIRDLVRDLQTSAFADSVSVSQSENIATLEMKNRILFEAGDERVLEEGGRLLDYLAAYLRDGELLASIEGHTDNQPIHNSRYKSNWELSTARAVAVTHRLLELGVDPGLIRASGLADTRPVADNASTEGRARNRRVTIVLQPRPASRG